MGGGTRGVDKGKTLGEDGVSNEEEGVTGLPNLSVSHSGEDSGEEYTDGLSPSSLSSSSNPPVEGRGGVSSCLFGGSESAC